MTKTLNWTPENIERLWNHESSIPENYFTFQFGRNMLRQFRPWLIDKKNILDYGCGMGHLIGHLLEEMRGVQIYGADISTESIYKVNQNYGLKPMFKGAFLPNELLRKKQHFEVILLPETIEHLDEKNMKKVFSDINQLLYSYGVLVITTPNNEDLKASEVYCPVCDHTFHRWQHMRSWNPEGLDKFLHESGFTVKSIQETDFSFPHHSTKAQLKRFAKYLLGRTISRPHLLAVACKT